MVKIEEVKLKDLNNGDQIAVMGNVVDLSPWLLPFTVHTNHTYLHHGIFDKENFAVIDFHGNNKANARPKRRDFTEFFAGHTKLYRLVYEEGEKCLPVDETMQMANKAVEQRSSWPAYHLIQNNCESFATYLKTGRAISQQVLEALISWTRQLSHGHVFKTIAGSSVGGSFPGSFSSGGKGSFSK